MPSTPGPTKVYLNFTDVSPRPGVAPVVIWRNARIVTRAAAAPGRGVPGAAADGAAAAATVTGAGRGRGLAAPILSTKPLLAALPADVARTLAFGMQLDGTSMGPEDFATTQPVSFTIDLPAGSHVLEFQADAELGTDRNVVVRLMISVPP